ncbi:MAG: DUF305 domain-containing protein [Cytophagaceae bacterium]|nr:DUF305 domain-containing protein [Cytophagaceae bacterium]
MKTKMMFYFLLMGFAAFYSCKDNDDDDKVTPQPVDNSAFYTANDTAMVNFMTRMDTMTMTMDPDVDFAQMMIDHHGLAISMANIELQYGHEQKAKDIASQTKAANIASRTRLQQFLATHGAPVMDADANEFMAKMDSVMMKMNETMKSFHKSNDPDYDFSEMMTHHHQGAIDMSELELDYGNDAAAREEAQKQIDEQQMEIIELAKFRTEHGQPH